MYATTSNQCHIGRPFMTSMGGGNFPVRCILSSALEVMPRAMAHSSRVSQSFSGPETVRSVGILCLRPGRTAPDRHSLSIARCEHGVGDPKRIRRQCLQAILVDVVERLLGRTHRLVLASRLASM